MKSRQRHRKFARLSRVPQSFHRRPRRASFEVLETRNMLASDPFSIVMLPDSQKYTDGVDSRGNAAPNESQTYFNSQMEWVVDNLNERNIKFVTHVGDVIEYSSSASERATRWARADAAFDLLDGNLGDNPDGVVPYSVVLGNHDYEAKNDHRHDADGGAASFVANFGPARFTQAGGNYRSWYGGASANGANSYQRFESDQYEFLHIALEFEARRDSNPNLDAVDWAQSVIDAHPGVPVIVSTHAYLTPSESRNWSRSNTDTGRNGETIFNELVRTNPEIFMVLSGHFTGARQRTVENLAGAELFEILVDYQGDAEGGGGYFRVFEFSPDENTIAATSISNVPGHAPLGNSGSRENAFGLEVDFQTRIAMQTTARLTTPLDNGSTITAGDDDSLPAFGQVRVQENPHEFVVQLTDVDDGISDTTVTSSAVQLYRDGTLLTAGSPNGYDFSYNTSANTVTLLPRGATEFGAGDYEIVVGSTSAIRNGDGLAMAPTTISVDVATSSSSTTSLTRVYDFGVDTWLQSGYDNNSASSAMKVDGSPTIHGLIQFPDLTSGDNRIPVGSVIESVSLEFDVVGDPVDGGGADQGHVPALHRMATSWSSAASWSSSFGGNGISANGTEAAAIADASFGGAHSSSTAPMYHSDEFPGLLQTVQGWIDGTMGNHGWALLPSGSSGISLGSFESVSRPRLSVTFAPPPTESAPAAAVYDQGSDTWLQSGHGNNSASPAIKVDGSPTIHGLIQFPGLTSGPDRIPAGSVIESVSLEFDVVGDPVDGGGPDQGHVPALHRMISSWTDGASWSSSFGGNGIGANGSEAAASADASFGGAHSSGADPVYRSDQFPDLLTTVQGWVDGAFANHGWALLPSGSSGISLGAFESAARPRLVVSFAPPQPQSAAVPRQAAAAGAAVAQPVAGAAVVEEDHSVAPIAEQANVRTRDAAFAQMADEPYSRAVVSRWHPAVLPISQRDDRERLVDVAVKPRGIDASLRGPVVCRPLVDDEMLPVDTHQDPMNSVNADDAKLP